MKLLFIFQVFFITKKKPFSSILKTAFNMLFVCHVIQKDTKKKHIKTNRVCDTTDCVFQKPPLLASKLPSLSYLLEQTKDIMAVATHFAIDEMASAIRAHSILSTASASKPSASTEAQPTSGGGNGGSKEEAVSGYDRWNLRDDSTIEYGYLHKTGGAGIEESKDGGFYITTAINYTNGPAHMGHAYEAATSDVIARFQRLKGDRPAYFVTGSDEHGQKIATTAEGQGKKPIEICDKVCLSESDRLIIVSIASSRWLIDVLFGMMNLLRWSWFRFSCCVCFSILFRVFVLCWITHHHSLSLVQNWLPMSKSTYFDHQR